MKNNTGQLAQDKFKEANPKAVRLYDFRSAMGIIPVQPGDYVVPKYIIECKSTINAYFRKNNFDKRQLAMQKRYESLGVPVFYYLWFLCPGGLKGWYVPFRFVWDFFYTKGKGKFTMEEIKEMGREEL